MGGYLGFTIRLSENEIYKSRLHTGYIFDAIKDPKFLLKNKIFVENLALIAKNNSWHLAPYDYGIVLIDFVTNKIISVNKYTHINMFYLNTIVNFICSKLTKELNLEMDYVNFHNLSKVCLPALDQISELDLEKIILSNNNEAFLFNQSREAIRLLELYKTKKIKKMINIDEENYINILPEHSFKYIIKEIFKTKINAGFSPQIEFDTSPFDLILNEDSNKKSIKIAKKEILKLGFKLTDQEEEIWQEEQL